VLSEITDTLVTPFFSGRGTCSMPSICEEEHETKQRGDQDSIPDQLQITEFIKETMLAMVAFVDVICRTVAISISSRVPAPYVMEKLSILLGVRFAQSESEDCTSRKEDEIISLLSAKEAKLDEIIWITMEYIRTRVLLSIGGSHSLGRSPSDIDKGTRPLGP